MRIQESRKDISLLAVPGDINTFMSLFRREIPGSIITVDQPSNQNGEWWLDITAGKFSTSVAWRPTFGFGLFASDPGYGDLPDEILRAPEEACRKMLERAKRFCAENFMPAN